MMMVMMKKRCLLALAATFLSTAPMFCTPNKPNNTMGVEDTKRHALTAQITGIEWPWLNDLFDAQGNAQPLPTENGKNNFARITVMFNGKSSNTKEFLDKGTVGTTEKMNKYALFDKKLLAAGVFLLPFFTHLNNGTTFNMYTPQPGGTYTFLDDNGGLLQALLKDNNSPTANLLKDIAKMYSDNTGPKHCDPFYCTKCAPNATGTQETTILKLANTPKIKDTDVTTIVSQETLATLQHWHDQARGRSAVVFKWGDDQTVETLKFTPDCLPYNEKKNNKHLAEYQNFLAASPEHTVTFKKVIEKASQKPSWELVLAASKPNTPTDGTSSETIALPTQLIHANTCKGKTRCYLVRYLQVNLPKALQKEGQDNTVVTLGPVYTETEECKKCKKGRTVADSWSIHATNRMQEFLGNKANALFSQKPQDPSLADLALQAAVKNGQMKPESFLQERNDVVLQAVHIVDQRYIASGALVPSEQEGDVQNPTDASESTQL